MRVLLTNDDGFDAPGLVAGWHALRRLQNIQIDVIAPARPHSSAGHVLSDDMSVHCRQLDPFGEILVVEGTPVDCVCAAVHLPNRPRPDWVLAGINRGGNLGVDVYTSGTVAAARQGAIFGVPSVAISQLVRSPLPDDWDASARQAAAVLSALVAPHTPRPADVAPLLHAAAFRARQAASSMSGAPCWNVNLPRQPDSNEPLGLKLAPLSRDPIHLAYEHREESDGSAGLRYCGSYMNRPITPNTDVEAAFTGYVSLTLLPL